MTVASISPPRKRALRPWPRRGVDVPAAKSGKPVAFACTDWTERRWHLGGALGRAIVDAMEEAGSLRRDPGTRVVRLTGSLENWLDE